MASSLQPACDKALKALKELLRACADLLWSPTVLKLYVRKDRLQELPSCAGGLAAARQQVKSWRRVQHSLAGAVLQAHVAQRAVLMQLQTRETCPSEVSITAVRLQTRLFKGSTLAQACGQA